MAIVNLDKVLSGVNGNIESVVAYKSKTEKVDAYGNGLFVELVGLVGGYDSTFTGRAGEAKAGQVSADGSGDVVMLHAPELQYDEKKLMREFKNEAGKVVRGYRIATGDILTMTDEAIGLTSHDEIAVGDILEVKNGRLAKFVAGGDDTPQEPAGVSFTVLADAGNEIDTVEKAWTIQAV